MAKVSAIPALQNESFGAGKIANADGTTSVLVLGAGTDDTAIRGLLISNDDTSNDSDVQLIISNGTTNWLLDTVHVPAGSGADGTHAAVDGLANAALPLNSAGKKFLPLQAGYSLNAKVLVTVASGKTVTVSALGANY